MDMTALRAGNPAELPQGYRLALTVDLQKDKKLALLVNGLALGIAVVFGLGGCLAAPIAALFDMSDGIAAYALRFAVLLVGMFVYIILHEAVHGVCMTLFSEVRPRYGFTGMYAYAGSSAYFNKKCYIVIALAPIVVWGIVLQAVCMAVPQEWFWVAYAIQIINLAGAAGDLYVTWRFVSLPKDILVNDTGVAMTVYTR